MDVTPMQVDTDAVTAHDRETGDELVERQEELRLIDDGLDRALAGVGSVITIEGPAGIGKTTVLRWARRRAESRGLRVLGARGGELERDFAWGGVRQLLDRAGAGHRRRGAAALAEPVLAERPSDEASPSFAILHGLHWLLCDIAAERPLLLAIDDAHWLDGPSLRWLGYLAPRIDETPVLVLAAARGGDTERGGPAWRALTQDGAPVTLCPLSMMGVERILGRRSGVPPSTRFVSACHRLTGGNPFLLGELIDVARREGLAADDEGADELARLPPQLISRGVARRLRQLPQVARLVASAVALLGDRADLHRTAALSGLPEEEVADQVDDLVAAQVLTAGTELGFVHPLVRSAALQGLAPGRLALWHARAARVLDATGVGVEAVAGHLLAAPPRGDPWACERLRTAAAVADARGATKEAARLLQRTLDEPPPPAARAAVLRELAAVELARDPETSSAHFLAAAAIATVSEERARATLGAARALSYLGRQAEAADALERAMQEPGLPPSLVTELEATYLNTLRWDPATHARTVPLVHEVKRRAAAGEPMAPIMHANLALELLREGRDRVATVRHAERAWAGVDMGNAPEAMTFGIVVSPLAMAGREASALEAATDAIEAVRKRGLVSALAVASAGRASVRSMLGDISGALADAQTGLELARDPIAEAFGVLFGVGALVDRGDLDGAWAMLQHHDLLGPLRSNVWPFPWVQAKRGWLRYLRGDPEGALDDLRAFDGWARVFGLDNPAVTDPPWRTAMARVLLSLGEVGEARRLAEADLAAARRWGTPAPIAVALRTCGLIQGGPDGLDLLRRSVAVLSASPARLERARCLHEFGAALRRANHRHAAQQALRSALHLAGECGALGVAESARTELAATGARPRRTALHGRDSLTPSELRVVQLAMEGRGNTAIAQALFVTRRTVETHLTKAYAKLDVRTRAELPEAMGARIVGDRIGLAPSGAPH